MPNIAYAPEVPRGEYVVSKKQDDGIYYVLQCSLDLAYAWFGSGILKDIRLSGGEGYIIINPQDWETDYWGFKRNAKESDES